MRHPSPKMRHPFLENATPDKKDTKIRGFVKVRDRLDEFFREFLERFVFLGKGMGAGRRFELPISEL